MRLEAHDFQYGLWIVSGKEQTIKGAVRRARGMNAIRRPSLLSRWGSTQLYSLAAHSLARFNDVRFQGVSTSLYRNGISILSGLNGNRLTFAKMPPQVAIFDYLFVAGGGALKKVDTGGNVQQWGINAPASDPTVADGGAGSLPAGTYQYLVTFKNTATASRSNPNPNTQSVTIAASHQVSLTNIPVSSDSQVNARELWRSQANNSLLFLLATINDNTTTTYTDNILDANLGTQQVQLDNVPPQASYNDCWGPYAGRMWWGRDDGSLATQGRVYYSPSGRPESVTSFIDVVNPDDHVQKGLVWNEQNWVFTQSGLWRILGDTEPFDRVRVGGVPGTFYPFTVKATPYGIAYAAYDGVRLFNGNTSSLIGDTQLQPIFRGEALENLTAFTPLVAEYARDEYFLSDGSTQCLAINLSNGTWRDLGIGPTALFQEHNTASLIASFASQVGILEDPGVVQDFGAPIPLEWEMAGSLADVARFGVIQRVYLDIDTKNEVVTPQLVVDGTVTTYATFQSNGRTKIEFSPNLAARLFSIRLTGNISHQVELYDLAVDVYLPGDAQQRAAA